MRDAHISHSCSSPQVRTRPLSAAMQIGGLRSPSMAIAGNVVGWPCDSDYLGLLEPFNSLLANNYSSLTSAIACSGF
jgi:hypothetical protein